MCTTEKINTRPKMYKSSSRPTRPLPNDYNQINDLDVSPKPKRKRRLINFPRIACFISVLIIGILIVFTYYFTQRKGMCCKSTNVCTSKNCILSAASILKTIDISADPCNDFYQFSCGNSINYFHHKPNFYMSQTKYKLKLDLKNIIESMSSDEKLDYVRNVRKFYFSCLDEDSIEKLDIKPLYTAIESLGGWPVVKGELWPTERLHYDWLNTYIMMRKIGIKAESIVKLTVGTDIKNSSRYIPYIDQPKFNINSKRLNNTDHYFNLMVQIAEMMGADRIDAQNELLEVLVFEKELINISLSEDDHRNKSYFNNNYMKVHQIETLAPNIDWIRYLTEFIGIPVNDNTEVIVFVPAYIKKLDEKLSGTKPRVLANYLIWNAIFSNLPLLSRKWREHKEKYIQNTNQDYEVENRWEVCVKQVQKYMPFALGSIYMQKYFNNKDKVEVISMMNNIRESFIEMLDNNKWMSDEVREKAEEKSLLMELRIGFPQDLLNQNIMDSSLSNIEISDNYFKNVMNLKLKIINQTMNKISKENIKEQLSWEKIVNTADVILKYKPDMNALLISSAFINNYIFKDDLPKYLNYGSLGILMSQQMMNGFNELGRLHDAKGFYGNWWDPYSQKRFEQQKQCFEDEYKYSNHSIKGLSLKNRMTLIQRVITDSGAFKQSILAYNGFVKRNGKEFGLIGFNYTPQQLFWMNAANTICFKHLQNDIIDISPHQIAKYRINFVLSNLNEFSEAFNCPIGSNMNKLNKCSLW